MTHQKPRRSIKGALRRTASLFIPCLFAALAPVERAEMLDLDLYLHTIALAVFLVIFPFWRLLYVVVKMRMGDD